MSNTHGRHQRFIAAAAPLLALLAFAAHDLAGSDDGYPLARQCTATFDPDTVPIQSDSVVVGYAVPDSIGAITAVTPAEDSGILPGRIDTEARTVSLGTASATAGDWALTLVGDSSRTCVGTLTVVGIDRR